MRSEHFLLSLARRMIMNKRTINFVTVAIPLVVTVVAWARLRKDRSEQTIDDEYNTSNDRSCHQNKPSCELS